jgi:hypothetical protein
MTEPLYFGKHTIHYEDPEIAVVTYHGRVSLDETRGMIAVEDIRGPHAEFQLTLCDLREFEGMDGAARKLAAERPRPAATYFNAYIGASFSMRVFVGMWSRAANLLQGEKNVTAFFDDHASARKWLIEQRAKILGSEAKREEKQ